MIGIKNCFMFEVGVADQYPILCKINKRKSNISKNLSDVLYRDKSKFTAEHFCEDFGDKILTPTSICLN